MTSLRDQVLRGGVYLALRQGLGMVVSVVGAMLLVRALGPAPYGIYAAAIGLATYAQSVGLWGVDVFLVRRAGDDDPEVYHAAFTGLLVSGLVLGVVMGLLASWAGDWIRVPGFARVARVIFLGLPLSLVTTVPLARLERALDYRRVALVELVAQLLYYGVSLPLAWRGAHAPAPVAGWWAQLGLLSVGCFTLSRYRPRLRWRPEAIRAMASYGLSYSSSMWVWQLRNLVSPLIVGRYAGVQAVGYVALSVRLVDILSFVKTATYRLSVAVLARIQDDRSRLRSAVEQGMRFQILGLAPFLIGFALLAPFILPALFGARWDAVQVIFPYIALAYLVNAMFNLHSSVLYVLRRNWAVTAFHAAHVATFGGAAWLLVPRFGMVGYGWAEACALWAYVLIHHFLAEAVGPPSYRLPLLWTGGAALLLFSAYTGWIGALLGAAVLVLPETRRELARLPATFRGLRHAA
jgi:O-antigen/teichoic acid export membrane protein